MTVWLYFIAGTFLAYFAVLIYSERYEPRRTGIEFKFKEQTLLITEVGRDSPASRAGLKPNDVLLKLDGQAMRAWEDWRRFEANRKIGHDYRLEIERAEQRFELQLTLSRQPGDSLSPLETKRFVQFFFLLLALILVFLRPRDRVAQIGALLLAAVGTAPVFPGDEMTAVWRELPALLGAMLWIPEITHIMLLPLFFTLFAVFPKRLFRTGWPWVVVWTPALILTGYWAPHIYDHIYHPPVLIDLPRWFRFVIGLAVLIYGGGTLAALALNYHRLPEMKDRRSIRVLVVGASVGLLPTLLFLTAIFWGTLTQSSVVWYFVSPPYKHFALACAPAFPLSFIYTLVRHRIVFNPASPIG